MLMGRPRTARAKAERALGGGFPTPVKRAMRPFGTGWGGGRARRIRVVTTGRSETSTRIGRRLPGGERRRRAAGLTPLPTAKGLQRASQTTVTVLSI